MSQKDKKEKNPEQTNLHEEEIAKIQAEKVKLEEEVKETQNKYLRSIAELDNFRKRMQKEKTEAISYAVESTISEFLSLIDNFENALNFAKESSEEVKNWSFGFQMILSQMKEILLNHGVVAFHSIGNSFDPHYHEAMEIIETNDHPDGTIIEEFAKGYKSASRIIRPAKVKVTKKIIEQKNNEQPINDKQDLQDVDETTGKENSSDGSSSCD
ncbi:MAG: nucleotide exchange factor GrpE [Parachlamydiales bacterium]|jgi:molecular chaperone GrpE